MKCLLNFILTSGLISARYTRRVIWYMYQWPMDWVFTWTILTGETLFLFLILWDQIQCSQHVVKIWKRQEKGGGFHFSLTETTDLEKLRFLDRKQRKNVKLKGKFFVDVMFYFRIGRRVNMQKLKISDFPATSDSNEQNQIHMTTNELKKSHQDVGYTASGRIHLICSLSIKKLFKLQYEIVL